MKKIIIIFSILLLVLFVVLFVYGLFKSTSLPPKQPPNWNSKNSSYTILKQDGNYLVEYVIDGERGKYFVGNSKVDLEKYVGKRVIIEGSFPVNYYDNETNNQCVNGSCHKIFNSLFSLFQRLSTSTVNIDSLSTTK